MARGECNCGAVAFEIDADISDVFVCHCSICRKFTGSNGIAVVVIDNNAFDGCAAKTKSRPGRSQTPIGSAGFAACAVLPCPAQTTSRERSFRLD